jgi:predicted GNAT family N-acyltransferase
MEVKQIDAKDTYEIRQKVLRPGKPIEACKFSGDNDEMTFHLGAYVNDTLVSVASFYMDNHPKIDAPYQFRLRGMATLPEFRGQGMSSALLRTAFPLIKKNHVKIVWCNARKSAVGFYQKVGFTTIGEPFDIEDIGPHLLMQKNLD